jgi:hypothetical protein
MNHRRERVIASKKRKKEELIERFSSLVDTLSPDLLMDAVAMLEREEERLENDDCRRNFTELTSSHVASVGDYIVLNKYRVDGYLHELNNSDGRTKQGSINHNEARMVSRSWETIKRTTKIHIK